MSALITYLLGALGGWSLRVLWVEIRQFRHGAKTLKQLMREQGIKPVRSIDDLAAPEGERLNDEEWAKWQAATREARGHE